MNDLASVVNMWINNTLNSLGNFAPFLACFLIIIESMIPILPLFVFITINFLAFGKVIGFIISWLCTIIGCMISYFLIKKVSEKKVKKICQKNPSINKIMTKIKKLKLTQIAVILAMPFTPAFAVNIAAGLVNYDVKKYIISLLIGKIFLVYFWGFVGTSLIESVQNPIIIIKILIMLLAAFIISKIVSKIFEIN